MALSLVVYPDNYRIFTNTRSTASRLGGGGVPTPRTKAEGAEYIQLFFSLYLTMGSSLASGTNYMGTSIALRDPLIMQLV